jgi:hypothetical protein
LQVEVGGRLLICACSLAAASGSRVGYLLGKKQGWWRVCWLHVQNRMIGLPGDLITHFCVDFLWVDSAW